MNHDKYKDYTTEDFVLDSSFIRHTLHPNQNDNQFWSEIQQQYPEQKPIMEEASFLITHLRADKEKVSDTRITAIFGKIEASRKQRQLLRRIVISAAAVLTLAIGIGGFLWYQTTIGKTEFNYAQIDPQAKEQGLVILADGTTKAFNTEHTTILQDSLGHVLVNNEQINHKKPDAAISSDAMNTIIVPFGKRSSITLADGTKIILNSGSQLSYPNNFKKRSREIHLIGEAFLEVAKDQKRPFRVNTSGVQIEVLGTKFNVSCYQDDNTIQAVLVEGKITISEQREFSKPITMIPGERTTFEKRDKTLFKDNVDTQIYTSWINGYLVFENEPTIMVLRKLERFYDKKISSTIALDNQTFSGKLDLKENIDVVLNNIAFATNWQIKKNNNEYLILKNN